MTFQGADGSTTKMLVEPGATVASLLLDAELKMPAGSDFSKWLIEFGASDSKVSEFGAGGFWLRASSRIESA